MEERRRALRHPVNLKAQYRARGRSAAAVLVLDLSALGCRIEGLHSLEEGGYGWLKLDQLEGIYSRVAWHRDTFAGLEFETQLHESVVERLATSSAVPRPTEELCSIATRTRALARKEESLSVALELISLGAEAERISKGK